MRNRFSLGTFVTLVAFGAMASMAQATLLIPGGSVAPSPTPSPLGATLVGDTGVQAFVSVDITSFSGTLRTQVFTGDVNNPFGAGFLTFTYLLTNNGPDPIEQLSANNFTGYNVDAAFSVTAPPGVIPFDVTRSASGKIVGFQFDPSGPSALLGGGATAMLVLHTNALTFIPITNSLINSSVATVSSLSPSLIPEPTTVGFGLASMALLAIRRRNAR